MQPLVFILFFGAISSAMPISPPEVTKTSNAPTQHNHITARDDPDHSGILIYPSDANEILRVPIFPPKVKPHHRKPPHKPTVRDLVLGTGKDEHGLPYDPNNPMSVDYRKERYYHADCKQGPNKAVRGQQTGWLGLCHEYPQDGWKRDAMPQNPKVYGLVGSTGVALILPGDPVSQQTGPSDDFIDDNDESAPANGSVERRDTTVYLTPIDKSDPIFLPSNL